MSTVLVVSTNEQFKQACLAELALFDLDLRFVSSEQAALHYVSAHQLVDLVIFNSASDSKDLYHVLEVLRSFRPQVHVILASACFDYWNDFKSWMADDCVVTSPDLKELGDRVLRLLPGSEGAKGRENGRFCVDWE